MKSVRLHFIALLGAVVMTASAQVPPIVHYQGRVAVGGTNFTGNGLFKFALVNSNGTVSFWSNDGSSAAGSQPTASVTLPTTNGLYAVLLGDTALAGMTLGIPGTAFTNFDVRLRIWFSDGSGFQQLAPDQRIAAVGYALMAATVPDGAITSNKLANNSVTAGKIAGGAIFGTNLANNSVTSNQLATSQSLGGSGVSGQLHVYSTAAGTPSISLLGSGSQISTYGSDGLEQIRLWGPSWGEILLNDTTGNDTTVVLSANSNNGGTLTLLHSNNSSRALLSASSAAGDLSLYGTNGVTRTRLHGGTDGSYLTLYAADGSSGILLDGDDAGGGSISVRNTNSASRVFIDGQGNSGGGQITMYSGDGQVGAYLYGDSGGAGAFYLYNTNALLRATLDGLGNQGGGQILLYANDGSSTVNFYGDSTTAPGGGEVSVRNNVSITAAQLLGYSWGGRLDTKDASGADTVIIGSSAISGGFAYFYQGDGDLGVLVDGDDNGAGYVAVYGTNGLANIILDGQSSGEGRIICDVLQINGGADLSEQFDIKSIHSPLKPGMIVCIDPQNPGQLVTSSKAHDRTVAGIVSGAGGVKPGMLMGQAGTAADGKHPVALTGRVYCWVDADQGAVQPGDLITTSATPGHGMKVKSHDKAQGAVIGKAMSPLEKGRGLVLVLVSLQ